jgi:hypothetical protein
LALHGWDESIFALDSLISKTWPWVGGAGKDWCRRYIDTALVMDWSRGEFFGNSRMGTVVDNNAWRFANWAERGALLSLQILMFLFLLLLFLISSLPVGGFDDLGLLVTPISLPRFYFLVVDRRDASFHEEKSAALATTAP